MLYLFDPINGVKTETTYEKLVGITGLNKAYLMSIKSKRRKIKSINCYIVDDKTRKKELNELRQKEVIKGEIWKDIKESDGTYQISDYGRVRRLYKNGKQKIFSLYTKHKKIKGLYVKVKIQGKIKECRVSRLVAEHFIHKPKDCNIVWHKNEDIYDNYALNLEWIDQKTLANRTVHKSNSIAVAKIHPVTGEVLEEYRSIREAGKKNYVNYESIRQYLLGKQKHAGGFKWAKIDCPFI